MPLVLGFQSVDECYFIHLYRHILMNEDINIQIEYMSRRKMHVHREVCLDVSSIKTINYEMC